jgi:hypothetical protein
VHSHLLGFAEVPMDSTLFKQAMSGDTDAQVRENHLCSVIVIFHKHLIAVSVVAA